MSKVNELKNKLLRCPFCGSENLEMDVIGLGIKPYKYTVHCKECGVSGPFKDTGGNSKDNKLKAIKLWNTRWKY